MATTIAGGGSGGERASRWSDLQPDILSSIADRLDPKIGILRLRSVCKSWRSSLSPSNSAIKFPLKLPFQLSSGGSPSIPSLHPTPQLFLRQRSVYLLSPPKTLLIGGSSSSSFLVKVEERENGNPLNTVSLINPLLSQPQYLRLPQPKTPLNLLNYSITLVCESHVVCSDVDSAENPIRKAVVSTNFFKEGDFVVLCMKSSGNLMIWRNGDEGLTEIEANGRSFDDIISYNGKFFATADRKGRLVMIDKRLKPIVLVPRLIFGNGNSTHLVECDGCLYLVDRDGDDGGVRFGVFKLDDKGRFWDYELDLNECVFFVGDDVSFALSRKDYNGGIRNVIYYKYVSNYNDGIDEFIKVFDMKTNTSSSLVESEGYDMLIRPPSRWFNWDAALSFH